MYILHFAYLCVDGNLGYVHLLAIVNNAAANTGVQVSILVPCFQFFGAYTYNSRIARSHGNSSLLVLGTEMLSFPAVGPFDIHTCNAQVFEFLHHH